MSYDYALREVRRVVDGDTLDAVLSKSHDFGFGHVSLDQALVRLRLVIVDTPEKSSPEYALATEFTRTWLFDHFGEVRVRTFKPRYVVADGGFGRWLADFYLPDGTTLSGELLRAGYMRYVP